MFAGAHIMNTKRIAWINSVVNLLFKPEIDAVNNVLQEIYNDCTKEKGTPNFVYKGTEYIVSDPSKFSTKPLSKKMKPRVNAYLDSRNELNSNKEKVTNYLLTNKASNNDDLFFLLPKSCHPLLAEKIVNNNSPTLKDKPSNYDEIGEYINELMLLRMLE